MDLLLALFPEKYGHEIVNMNIVDTENKITTSSPDWVFSGDNWETGEKNATPSSSDEDISISNSSWNAESCKALLTEKKNTVSSKSKKISKKLGKEIRNQ